MKPSNEHPGDRDVVPEEAMKFQDVVPNEAVRLGNTSDYHIGVCFSVCYLRDILSNVQRGGEGNRRNSKNGAHDTQAVREEQGLADKLKNKLIRRKSDNKDSKQGEPEAVEDEQQPSQLSMNRAH